MFTHGDMAREALPLPEGDHNIIIDEDEELRRGLRIADYMEVLCARYVQSASIYFCPAARVVLVALVPRLVHVPLRTFTFALRRYTFTRRTCVYGGGYILHSITEYVSPGRC
jgi:hypothetical protein